MISQFVWRNSRLDVAYWRMTFKLLTSDNMYLWCKQPPPVQVLFWVNNVWTLLGMCFWQYGLRDNDSFAFQCSRLPNSPTSIIPRPYMHQLLWLFMGNLWPVVAFCVALLWGMTFHNAHNGTHTAVSWSPSLPFSLPPSLPPFLLPLQEGSRVPLELDVDTSVLVGQRVVVKYLPGTSECGVCGVCVVCVWRV